MVTHYGRVTIFCECLCTQYARTCKLHSGHGHFKAPKGNKSTFFFQEIDDFSKTEL